MRLAKSGEKANVKLAWQYQVKMARSSGNGNVTAMNGWVR